MKNFLSLSRRLQSSAPPSASNTFQVLDRPSEPLRRRVKTGRSEQFNVRVKADFKQRVEELAAAEKETIGGLLEAMLAAYESGVRPPQNGIPVAEARAGRTRSMRLWATDEVYEAVGKIAAERKLTVFGLFEDLLAREVNRLDPNGDRLGVVLKR